MNYFRRCNRIVSSCCKSVDTDSVEWSMIRKECIRIGKQYPSKDYSTRWLTDNAIVIRFEDAQCRISLAYAKMLKSKDVRRFDLHYYILKLMSLSGVPISDKILISVLSLADDNCDVDSENELSTTESMSSASTKSSSSVSSSSEEDEVKETKKEPLKLSTEEYDPNIFLHLINETFNKQLTEYSQIEEDDDLCDGFSFTGNREEDESARRKKIENAIGMLANLNTQLTKK